MAVRESQKRANKAYDEKHDRHVIGGTVFGEEYKRMEAYAKIKGVTVSKLVILCTRHCMIEDGFTFGDEPENYGNI